MGDGGDGLVLADQTTPAVTLIGGHTASDPMLAAPTRPSLVELFRRG
jgi:hypothetical protein